MLCQQDLDHAARHRLKAFEAFVASTAERELREAQDAFIERRDEFTNLDVLAEQVKETLAEIQIEHEGTSRIVEAALKAAESRRGAIDLALREDGDVAEDCPDLKPVATEIDAVALQLSDRAAALETSIDPEKQEKLNEEAQELRARNVLAEHEEIVLAEIERKRKHAAYELCLRETRTNAITHKSTVLTRKSGTRPSASCR